MKSLITLACVVLIPLLIFAQSPEDEWTPIYKNFDYSNNENVNNIFKAQFIPQAGHTQKVASLSFSPDGKLLISSSLDKSVKLWDVETGKLIRTEMAHPTNPIARFSPDGRFYFSSNSYAYEYHEGGRITNIWETKTGFLLASFETDGGYGCFSADSKKFFYLKLSNDYRKGPKINDFPSEKIKIDFEEIEYIHGNTGEEIRLNVSQNEKYMSLREVVNSKNLKTLINISNFIAFSNDNQYVLDDDNGLTIKEIANGNSCKIGNFSGSACFTPDSKYVVYGINSEIVVLDIVSKKEIKRLKIDQSASIIDISPYGKYLAYVINEDEKIRIIDFETGNLIRICGAGSYPISLVCNPIDQEAIIGYSDAKIRCWDLNEISLKNETYTLKYPVHKVNVSKDGKFLAAACDSTIYKWDRDSHKLLFQDYYKNYKDESVLIRMPDIHFSWWMNKNGTFQFHYHIATFEDTKSRKTSYSQAWDHSGKYYAVGFYDGKVRIDGYYAKVERYHDGRMGTWVQDGRIDYQKNKGGNGKSIVSGLSFSSDDNYLAGGTVGNQITIWDLKQLPRKYININTGRNTWLGDLSFSSDGKLLVVIDDDGSTKLINWMEGKYVTLLSDGNEWLAFNNDGYFDGSPNGSSLMAMVKETSVFGIDQLAIQNNRPDILLQTLGIENKELQDHYYALYKKRLKKAGFTEEQLSSDLHIPFATISGLKLNGKFLSLNISLKDAKYNLRKYNIFINDVPFYGSYGKEISGNTIELNENIELTYGINKIEVSCTNEKGVESYRALTYATYNGETKGNLYFLAFGVSKYQNSSYNLQYADKDALDLEKVMQNFKGKGFENVYTKVLTNEQVTPDAISAAREFVKNAGVDDTFVLFIAGHGLHDTNPEATYYFMTSNADLKNLKGTAADFETIEDLLQGIPPRNKLFLMDACESGEIDEEDQGQMMATASGVGINSRGFKVLQATTSTGSVAGASPKRTYLFQKDRYIYNDLVRRSGAIVFSSCKGGELSYERSDIENGLFTEYIMKALTTSEADKDNNSFVSTDELRQYVSEQVAKASGDLQHPTVDRDNIYQKFGFQIK